MREHRAFRHASSARGVDDDRDVVGISAIQARVHQRSELRLVAPADIHERRERHQAWFDVAPHALHIDANDGFEIRQSAVVAAGVDDLVGLFLIAADHDLRARMPQDVLHLRPGIGRIDPEPGAAERLRGEVREHPFRRVLAGDGEPIAGAEADRVRADRDDADSFVLYRSAAKVGIF